MLPSRAVAEDTPEGEVDFKSSTEKPRQADRSEFGRCSNKSKQVRSSRLSRMNEVRRGVDPRARCSGANRLLNILLLLRFLSDWNAVLGV